MKNFIIIAILAALVGCADHLDVPTYNNITGASYWQVPGDAEAYAIGIQSNYHDLLTSFTGYMSVSEGRADLVVPGTGGPALTGSRENHTQTALGGALDWQAYYNLVHHCNLLLANTPAITFNSESNKNNILAQGHLYRALIYFDLARIFGGVPLISEPTLGKPAESEYPSRASVDDTFAFIKADIEEALRLYPSDGIADKNFLSKVAANALKAEVYMWTAKALNPRNSPNTSDLNTAIAAMDQVLASADISWEPNYSDIFQRSANNADEYIFATFHGIADNVQDNVFRRITIREVFIPDTYTGPDFPHSINAEGHSNISYSDYLNNTLYDPSDLRFINNCVNVSSTENVVIKFPGFYDAAANRRYWDNDIPIFRYSDILLLKAEALNSLGQTGDAITIVNQTRNRGGIGNYTGPSDQASVEIEILDERARDLAFENKRWWDLCRAHLVSTYVDRFMTSRGDDATDQNVWNYYYSPVSESVTLANTNIAQSPGY